MPNQSKPHGALALAWCSGVLHDGLVAAAGAFGSGTVCGMHGVLIRGGSFWFGIHPLQVLIPDKKVCNYQGRRKSLTQEQPDEHVDHETDTK